ncbi:unknown [Bacteroides intestinalis CAG:315]|nr:unknown [Bacteroides intestinalis CAG:315]
MYGLGESSSVSVNIHLKKRFKKTFGSMKMLHEDIRTEYSKTGLYPLRRYLWHNFYKATPFSTDGVAITSKGCSHPGERV